MAAAGTWRKSDDDDATTAARQRATQDKESEALRELGTHKHRRREGFTWRYSASSH